MIGATAATKSTDPSPSPQASMMSDFGVLPQTETTGHHVQYATTKERGSVGESPSKGAKPSIAPILGSSKKPPTTQSFINLRKVSAPTMASSNSNVPSDSQTSFSKFTGLTSNKSSDRPTANGDIAREAFNAKVSVILGVVPKFPDR
jgi:hypothetical protein